MEKYFDFVASNVANEVGIRDCMLDFSLKTGARRIQIGATRQPGNMEPMNE
jgi:hypothetical protein